MYLSENIQKKWGAILEHADLPEIKDNYKKTVTAILLENQEKALHEERQMLNELAPANSIGDGTTGVAKYDPIMIGLVRRAMPNLMAYDICGVQPMTGPTGLIFAMRSVYGNTRTVANGTEALFNEANTEFSASTYTSALSNSGTPYSGTHAGGTDPTASGYAAARGMSTAQAEALGDSSSNAFGQMGFSIDKTTVTATSRALKAQYTLELAQDLKAVHGLDAESELSNIL